MAEADLVLRPVKSVRVKHVTPSSSKVEPVDGGWRPTFQYMTSRDEFEGNLLIMLHGLGDTEKSFFDLARKLNLPGTCVLSLQGPFPVPLMDTPSFSYLPLSPMHYLTPTPPPFPTPEQLKALHTQTIPLIRNLLVHLTRDCGWNLQDIHLFGWGEGGTIALETGRSVGVDGITDFLDQDMTTDRQSILKRLASIVSISGPLISTPSVGAAALNIEIPVLYFHRPRGKGTASTTETPSSLTKTFKSVKHVVASFDLRSASQNERNEDIRMPSIEAEWRRVMKFWSRNLIQRPIDMGGEVYEVVR